ncbi:NADP-dependent glyceraldehyde-3-phosphate dehydrogenase [Weeksellaceae bacterium A-14]
MTFNDNIELFPKKEYLNHPLVEQEEYLVNGVFKPWKGDSKKVFAAIKANNNGVMEDIYLGKIPNAGLPEAMECLDAADRAYNNGFGYWPTLSVEDRIRHVETFIREMLGLREQIVQLLMWEIGKNRSDSEKEFDRTVAYIYDTIGALKELDRKSSTFTIEGGIIGQIRRSPLGITLCIGPYNYPLNETYTLLIPALIMGNVVLFKPPKYGCLLHYALSKALQKSFPKGVINYIYGKGADVIEPMMNTGKINVLTLIASSKVADQLKKSHPKVNRLRSILGLDAKNPGIILKDADLDLTVDECVAGSLSFNGQRCTALKILFVHEDIAEKFIRKFAKKVDELKVGMPWDNAFITPLPDESKIHYMNELVKDAEEHGAKIVNKSGGNSVGTLYAPTVVFPVNSEMKIYHVEQFGPVVPIVTFKNLQEPIDYMIGSDYGQQVSIFSTNSLEIAHMIDGFVNLVSRVNINTQSQRGPDVFPFTGRKDSAEGTLSVYDALRSFSIRTMVATRENDINKKIFNEIIEENESSFLSTKFLF